MLVLLNLSRAIACKINSGLDQEFVYYSNINIVSVSRS